MVNNNDIDTAMTSLNKIMAQEGLTKRWRLTRTYEKPTWVSWHIMAHFGFIYFCCWQMLVNECLQTRNRVNYEKSRAIYDEDMRNKIRFLMRKNRVDPYPGCWQRHWSDHFLCRLWLKYLESLCSIQNIPLHFVSFTVGKIHHELVN